MRVLLSLGLCIIGLLSLSACNNRQAATILIESLPKMVQHAEYSTSTYKRNPLCQAQYKPGSIVTLTEDTELLANCVYHRVTFRIAKSDIRLNCNGALLNGINTINRHPVAIPYSEEEKPMDQGILIHGAENHPLQNISIKNCRIHNYIDGIRVNFGITPKTHAALKNSSAEQAKILEDRLRGVAPQKIKINNVSIKDSHKHGIFINRYVNNLTFNNGLIEGSGNSGIYFESGTRENLVSHSKLRANGFHSYSRSERVLKPRQGITKREAIAVDSSAWNTLLGNRFEGNAAGGIFLYKNCYEHHNKAGQLPRRQHSHSNTIRNNRFENEHVGVWIASRQSRNLKNFNCGDPLMFEDKGLLSEKRYYYDYAPNTHVENNQFVNVQFGIKVEDDDAHIQHNRFSGRSDKDIMVGSAIRGIEKNNPVKNTLIESNQFDNENPKSIEILYGSLETNFQHNHKRNRTYQAPCTTPFAVPAQNAPKRSCTMIPKKLRQIALSVDSGTVLSAYDTTREGNSSGVWGKGEFVCENGRWLKRSGYCCFGESCQ